jgi:hypothetical protein
MKMLHKHHLWVLTTVATFIGISLFLGCQNNGEAPISQEKSVEVVESKSKQHRAFEDVDEEIGTRVQNSNEWNVVSASNVEDRLHRGEASLSCGSITGLKAEYPSQGSEYTIIKLNINNKINILDLGDLRESLYEVGQIKSTEGVFVIPKLERDRRSGFRTRNTCSRILYSPESIGSSCSEYFLSLVSGEDSSFVAIESDGNFVWAVGKESTYKKDKKIHNLNIINLDKFNSIYSKDQGEWRHLEHYMVNGYHDILEFTCHVDRDGSGICGYPPDSDPPFDKITVRFGYTETGNEARINPLEVFDSASGHCSTLSIDNLNIEAITIR